MPGIPAALRLAGALGVPVQRLADWVEDPAEEESVKPPGKRGRLRKGKWP
jgi:hypothetical protein